MFARLIGITGNCCNWELTNRSGATCTLPRGVFNFTNPGAISHNEILHLYKQYIDPSFTYKNFTLEEQAKILAVGRSNNELDSSKLVETCRQFGVEIPPIKKSIVGVFERMQKNLSIHL